MPLYRQTYVREGKVRGMTFWEENAELAALFAARVLEPFITKDKGSPLTLKHIGNSPYPSPDQRQRILL